MLRYSEYEQFPARLWSLCRVYNEAGYIVECERFLDADPSSLDWGYSRLLQQDAKGQGSVADGLTYLLSAAVQKELESIFCNSQATSLSVERKNYQDRRSCKHARVMSCARASRNSILQQFRHWRLERVAKRQRVVKQYRKMKFVNAQALAVMRNPECFPRAAGQLHWQQPKTKKQRQQLVHKGDKRRLAEIVDSQGDELRAEAKRLRDSAQAGLRRVSLFMPESNQEWLDWMKTHIAEFRGGMQTASEHRRSAYGRRLEPLPNLGEVPRLRPKQPTLSRWANKIKAARAGPFFLVKAEHCCLVVVASGVGNQCFGIQLQRCEDGQHMYLLNLETCFENCKDIQKIASEAALWDHGAVTEPEVYALTMELAILDGRIARFTVLEAELVRQSERQPASSSAGEELLDSESEHAVSEDESVASVVSKSCGSASDSDTGHADVAEDGQRDAAPNAEERAVAGTHVVWSCSYFTMANYRGKPDCKIILKDKWAVAAELGSNPRSKTLQIRNFDGREDGEPPVQTYIALKAWMLQRCVRQGWHRRNAERLEWFHRQEADLRADVEQASRGGLSAATVYALRQWCPAVLPGDL